MDLRVRHDAAIRDGIGGPSYKLTDCLLLHRQLAAGDLVAECGRLLIGRLDLHRGYLVHRLEDLFH